MENVKVIHSELAKRVEQTKRCKDNVLLDIDEIIECNKDEILKGTTEYTSCEQALPIISENLLDIFLYRKLYLYEQTDINKDGVLMALLDDYGYIFRQLENGYEFEEDLIRKIKLYFDVFSLPRFDMKDARDRQIKHILELPEGNVYRLRLYTVYLYELFEGISEVEKYLWINSILNDYYFRVIMPNEDEEVRIKRKKSLQRFELIESNKNSVPNLEKLYEGKKYIGRASVADLIKDVGWKPKPAGKNSRIAQENRLRQFFDWETHPTEKNKTITIIRTIYNEMLESGKPKLYESLIEIPLLYALYKAEDETIITTRKNFFYDIGIISPHFHKVPIQYYKDTLPENYIESDTDISMTRTIFYDSVYSKLRELLFSTLESLQKRKKIRYSTSTIIVIVGKERINVNELESKDAIEIDKKILEASDYALQHTYYYEDRRKRPCNNWENVMKYRKNQEFKSVYEEYISEQYGWDYTYEEIRITAGTKRSIEKSITEAQKKLRDTLIQYLKKNSQTKFNNRNNRINMEYQKLLNQIETTGLPESYYQDEFDKLASRVKPFPKYFLDIFDVMVDTEIDRNPKVERQVVKWKKENTPHFDLHNKV